MPETLNMQRGQCGKIWASHTRLPYSREVVRGRPVRKHWSTSIILLFAFLLYCGLSTIKAQQQQSCKDNAGRCDKELLLLRGEVDNKRQAIAVLLDANEQWQARAEKAEARLKDLEKAQPPVLSEPTLPVIPKD